MWCSSPCKAWGSFACMPAAAARPPVPCPPTAGRVASAGRLGIDQRQQPAHAHAAALAGPRSAQGSGLRTKWEAVGRFCLGHSRRCTSGSQSIPCRHPRSYAPLQREMRLTCEAPFARVCLPPHLNPPHPSHPITPSPTPPGLRRRAALCGRRGCCGCSRGSTRTRVPEAQKASQGPPLQLPPPS